MRYQILSINFFYQIAKSVILYNYDVLYPYTLINSCKQDFFSIKDLKTGVKIIIEMLLEHKITAN